jgi:hypothetical protein
MLSKIESLLESLRRLGIVSSARLYPFSGAPTRTTLFWKPLKLMACESVLQNRINNAVRDMGDVTEAALSK